MVSSVVQNGRMRRALALMVCLPFALMGVLTAHNLSYAIVAGESAGEQLGQTGHGYFAHIGEGLAFVLAVAFVAMCLDAARGHRHIRGRAPAAWPFALFGPLAFALQEHVERIAATGEIPWGAAAEPTFVLGIVLQLPFALFAYSFARVILMAARRVARELARTIATFQRRSCAQVFWHALPTPPRKVLRPAVVGVGGGRAPPL